MVQLMLLSTEFIDKQIFPHKSYWGCNINNARHHQNNVCIKSHSADNQFDHAYILKIMKQ